MDELAMLPAKSMFNDFFLIDLINYLIRIALFRGCKNYDFIIFFQIFYYFFCVWTNIYFDLYLEIAIKQINLTFTVVGGSEIEKLIVFLENTVPIYSLQ